MHLKEKCLVSDQQQMGSPTSSETKPSAWNQNLIYSGPSVSEANLKILACWLSPVQGSYFRTALPLILIIKVVFLPCFPPDYKKSVSRSPLSLVLGFIPQKTTNRQEGFCIQTLPVCHPLILHKSEKAETYKDLFAALFSHTKNIADHQAELHLLHKTDWDLPPFTPVFFTFH